MRTLYNWIAAVRKGRQSSYKAVTRFTLLFYLFQAGMLDEEDPTLYREFENLARKMGFRRVDGTTVYMALVRMRKDFALPQDWRGLRKYLAQALRIVANNPSEKLASFSARWDVPMRTLYNWIAAVRKGRGHKNKKRTLTPEDWAEFERRATERNIKRHIRKELKKRGKKREAARKFLQRRLPILGLEEIAKELRSGEPPL